MHKWNSLEIRKLQWMEGIYYYILFYGSGWCKERSKETEIFISLSCERTDNQYFYLVSQCAHTNIVHIETIKVCQAIEHVVCACVCTTNKNRIEKYRIITFTKNQGIPFRIFRREKWKTNLNLQTKTEIESGKMINFLSCVCYILVCNLVCDHFIRIHMVWWLGSRFLHQIMPSAHYTKNMIKTLNSSSLTFSMSPNCFVLFFVIRRLEAATLASFCNFIIIIDCINGECFSSFFFWFLVFFFLVSLNGRIKRKSVTQRTGTITR